MRYKALVNQLMQEFEMSSNFTVEGVLLEGGLIIPEEDPPFNTDYNNWISGDCWGSRGDTAEDAAARRERCRNLRREISEQIVARAKAILGVEDFRSVRIIPHPQGICLA